MKMVNGTCLDLLSDVVIATRHHIDVLPVLQLLLVQNFSNDKPIGALPGRDYVLTGMVLQII